MWVAGIIIALLVGGTIITALLAKFLFVVANIVTVDNIQGANEFVKTNVQDYINMLTDAINKVK